MLKKLPIKELSINFRKKICFFPIITLSNKEILKKNYKYYADFKITCNKKKYFGYLIKTSKKIKDKKIYKEQIYQKKIQIKKNKIYIHKNSEYNFIEKITSGAMKYLKLNFPELEDKWYLTTLKLQNYSKKIEHLDLIMISEIKSKKIILFNLLTKKKRIGELIFIKHEK